jgi:hypothetical protein
MPLELSIPAERTAPPKDLEIRPKQAKVWLDALPLAQSAEAARQVRANLVALSRSKLDTDVRIQLLDVYRPVANGILEALDAMYSKSALPLPPKAREALGLARDIAMEMAHGYKIALLEKTSKLIAFGARKQVPLLIYRIMEYGAAGIRSAYKSYTPVTAGSWQEFHRLYLHAEKEGIAGEVADAEAKASIFELYVELLLLSLTDPYRLSQGEVERTLAHIRANKGLVALSQSRPQTPTSAHFLVPCDADRPPKPASSANDDTGGPNWRLLDANGLADRLRQKRQAIESGNASATMTKAVGPEGLMLLAKLIALWGDPPKRMAKRDPMDTQVAICAGLKAVSHFVGLEQKIDLAREAEAIASGRTLPLVHIPDDPVSKSLGVAEWDVINQSAGGIKVKRANAASQSISVGEVVGIKYVGHERWTIGVVRWLTTFEDGALEFGIQFLAPAARAVAVQSTTTSSSGGARQGLMLFESEVSTEPDSMLTPPGTHADLREFEIEEDGMVSSVRAQGLIEKTGRFELFQVSPS